MDYQGNAHKQKEAAAEKPRPEKIVSGQVVEKKRGFLQRFKGVFFGGDVKNAARYLSADVILPAIRNLMVDATTRGVERVVFGESVAQRRRQPTYGASSRIMYNSPVRRPDRAYMPDQPPRQILRPTRRETNEFVFASREDADRVLETMTDILEKYQVVSFADLYDLMGLPVSPIDNKWGWADLRETC